MKSYSDSDTAITYKYDSDGLRTQKIVGSVQYDYYYVDGQLRYEKKGNEYEIIYRYNNDGTLASVTRNRFSDNKTDILYAVTNTRGDVIELRSDTGAVYAKYVYDSWGKLHSITDANGTAITDSSNIAVQNSIRYRGYVYDTETGLYYLQSRYYDPETGRFLNADDVSFIGASGNVLGYNAFAYCENNAVNGSDTTGFSKDVFSKVKLIANNLQKILLLQIMIDRLSNIISQRDTLKKIKNCAYAKINYIKSSNGFYNCSLIFCNNKNFNIGTAYYVDMKYASRNVWATYVDNILGSNFNRIWTNTYVSVGKSVLLGVIGFTNLYVGIATVLLGVINTVSEAEINKDINFANNSKTVLENNTSKTFVAITGIYSVNAFSSRTLYEGDDKIWPVLL